MVRELIAVIGASSTEMEHASLYSSTYVFLSQRATEPAPHPRRRRTARPGRGAGERARGPEAAAPTSHRPVLGHGAVVSIAVIFLTSGA